MQRHGEHAGPVGSQDRAWFQVGPDAYDAGFVGGRRIRQNPPGGRWFDRPGRSSSFGCSAHPDSIAPGGPVPPARALPSYAVGIDRHTST